MRDLLRISLVLTSGILVLVAPSNGAASSVECKDTPFDVVFLLDSSGSVGLVNFNTMLQFVSNFVSGFSIGPSHVQVGAVAFASNTKLQFNLNKYSSKPTLINAIMHIPYMMGFTYTGSALEFVRRNSFQAVNGGRSNVSHVLIIITDGQSTNKLMTLAQSKLLHQANISTFALGVGSGVDKNELEAIATNPTMVFTVNNFNDLRNIQAALKHQTCTIREEWKNWGVWSHCSVTCGTGTRVRTRQCVLTTCSGNSTQTKACDAGSCITTMAVTTPGCTFSVADIVFVIDSSGSVGSANFKKVLAFVEGIANSFNIGPTKVQVGALTFSNKAMLQFHLNKYATKAGVLAGIKTISFIGGSTNTAEALKYLRTISFLPQNGARAGVPKIAIVITDGMSNVVTATSLEAGLTQKTGVTMISIGVGDGVNMNELKAIATDPDIEHVFKVSNFEALKTIQKKLATQTCKVQRVTTPLPSLGPKCPAKADIVFVLDSSGSVGSSNFQKVLGFVKTISQHFQIGPNSVQIGIDTFDRSSRTEFTMTSHTDIRALLTATSKVPYRGGNTHTGEALQRLRTLSLTKASGARPNVPHIGIVITDGVSNGPKSATAEAKLTKAAGIKLFAIGVGPGVNPKELKAISSDPDSEFVFKADNFGALKSIASLLSQKSCNVVPKSTPTVPANCGSIADIVFVLDSSGSVGSQNFKKVLAFVKDLVDQFQIGSKNVRVGIIRYNSRSYLEFNLNKYTDKKALGAAILKIPYTGGNTATGGAINFMHFNMFTSTNGARTGVPKIGIVITDGRSNNKAVTLKEAKAAKMDGITLFALGVGAGIDGTELKGIATDPDSDHMFKVKGFSNLDAIKSLLVARACKAIPTDVVHPTPVHESVTRGAVSTVSTCQDRFLSDACRDLLPNCNKYDKEVCVSYTRWSQDFCPAYCNICPTDPAPTTEICEDKFRGCSELGHGWCLDYSNWAKDRCAKFCGYCGKNSTTNSTTTGGGFHGHCSYKGKTYKQNEKWQDGCNYECICIDANNGLYSCYHRCPIYYNLPPQCTMVTVSGHCCMEPICNFKGKVITTTGNKKGTSFGVDTCVYNGIKYYQGQTWRVGCDYECICTDASAGSWSCQSRCPTYQNLPSKCHLVTEPGKCCEEVKCEFVVTFGKLKGKGTLVGTGIRPTPLPCIDRVDCSNFGKGICTTITFLPWATKNCAKFCNICPTVPPLTTETCHHKGKTYKEGETFVENCQTCICEDARHGYARCFDNCVTYTNLPPTCHIIKKLGQCCPVIECVGGTFIGSRKTNNNTIGGLIIVNPQGSITPPTGIIHIQLTGCMYQGKFYHEHQIWSDGCKWQCKCEDGSTGLYKCQSKCPTFTNLPSQCTLEDIPGDFCCKYPVCNGTLTTILIPGYGKSVIGVGKVTSRISAGCRYNGTSYKTGQRWEDGCRYSCECVDGDRGIYSCIEKCPSINNVPVKCHLQPDPSNVCCKTMVCPSLVTTTTPPVMPKGVCIYKGVTYKQNQTWNDGCSQVCRCEKAQYGYYNCRSRCPTYHHIPSECRMLTDPKDSCCKFPHCNKNGTSPLGFIGTFVGTGKSLVGIAKLKGVCVYKDMLFRQGDKWKDGCELDCECTDASRGGYTCTEMCTRYISLPANCRMVQIPGQKCCQAPQCQPVLHCVDKDSTCSLQGTYVCRTDNRAWARENCAKFCKLCTTGPQVTASPTTTTGSMCVDKVDCRIEKLDFNPCADQYKSWGEINCPKTCGICVSPSPGVSNCKDMLPNCGDFSVNICGGPFLQWGKDNCAKHCGFCGTSKK